MTELNPEQRAAAHRVRAAMLRSIAVQEDVAAASVAAADSVRRLMKAVTDGDAQDVASHPDLTELNVQLDGYYGDV
ncbi:hypothetical protein ACFXPI_11090 [Streptomyces sp. NPDC059104]|uniref:hypothetical protein n=1 Tax=Streptomyces sp. NPDC059104 TaxID=3346729 RepID=UPI0036943821